MSKINNKRKRREENLYFDNGSFVVSDRNLRTPRKTYRIANIEKIALRRDPLYFALSLSFPALGLLIFFNNYLYDYERIFLGGGSALLLLVASRLGILFIESKALAEMAALAPMATLRQVREAVEQSIDDSYDKQQVIEEDD